MHCIVRRMLYKEKKLRICIKIGGHSWSGDLSLPKSDDRDILRGLRPYESQRTSRIRRDAPSRGWRNEDPTFRGNPTKSSDFHSDRAGLEIVSSMNGRRLLGPIERWQLVKLGRSRVTQHTWHTWSLRERERERTIKRLSRTSSIFEIMRCKWTESDDWPVNFKSQRKQIFLIVISWIRINGLGKIYKLTRRTILKIFFN